MNQEQTRKAMKYVSELKVTALVNIDDDEVLRLVIRTAYQCALGESVVLAALIIALKHVSLSSVDLEDIEWLRATTM